MDIAGEGDINRVLGQIQLHGLSTNNGLTGSGGGGGCFAGSFTGGITRGGRLRRSSLCRGGGILSRSDFNRSGGFLCGGFCSTAGTKSQHHAQGKKQGKNLFHVCLLFHK